MTDLRENALALAHGDEVTACGAGAPEPEKVVTRAIVYARFLLGYRDPEIAADPQSPDEATRA